MLALQNAVGARRSARSKHFKLVRFRRGSNNSDHGNTSMGPGDETGLRKQLRSWRILVVATLLAVLALAAVFGYRQIQAWNHLRAAEAARENRDFVQEREHLLHCLKVWDSNPELYLQAARAARHLRAF